MVPGDPRCEEQGAQRLLRLAVPLGAQSPMRLRLLPSCCWMWGYGLGPQPRAKSCPPLALGRGVWHSLGAVCHGGLGCGPGLGSGHGLSWSLGETFVGLVS